MERRTAILRRALMVLGLFLAVPDPVGAQTCDTELGSVTELGERVDIGTRYADLKKLSSSRRLESVSHQEAIKPIRYMRVRVRMGRPGARSWLLTVRDKAYHVVQTLGPEDFAGGGTDSLWTARVPGNWVWFDLDTAAGEDDVELQLEDYIAMPTSAERPYYSYQDETDKRILPLYESAEYRRRLGDGVAFLMGSWGTKAWCCSGVMIADDLLLTNWHCGGVRPMTESAYWQGDRCRDLIIDLSWDDDGIDREHVCTLVEATDKVLDYAVIRVKPLLKRDSVRPVTIRGTPVGDEEVVSVVHHPACMQKQISSDCRVERGDYPGWVDSSRHSEFTHRCDTEGGSSGAPVLDRDGLLVGLHHLGFDCDRKTRIYRDSVNKAVHLDAILKSLPARIRAEIPSLPGSEVPSPSVAGHRAAATCGSSSASSP